MSRYKPKIRTVPLGSAAWQRLRAQVLAEEPLCRDCTARGLVTPATDVDHIDNDGDNNARANLAALCHSCHSVKTAEDMGKRTTRGCDVKGFPLDPNHHWNRRNAPKKGANRGVDVLHEKSPAADTRQTAPDPLSYF